MVWLDVAQLLLCLGSAATAAWDHNQPAMLASLVGVFMALRLIEFDRVRASKEG